MPVFAVFMYMCTYKFTFTYESDHFNYEIILSDVILFFLSWNNCFTYGHAPV